MGRSLAAGPNIGWVFDLTHILAELGDRPFPKHSVAPLIEKMLSVLCEGPVELLGPHLPHLLHRILPFLTELEPRRTLVQGGKKTADHPLDFRLWKHPYAGLDDEILVKQKHFRADAGFVGGGIIGAREFFQRLS